MKYKVLLSFMAFFMILYKTGEGQEKAISPSIIIEGQFHGETPPLRDLPKVTDAEWQVLKLLRERDTAAFLQARLDARYKHVLLDEFQDTQPAPAR